MVRVAGQVETVVDLAVAVVVARVAALGQRDTDACVSRWRNPTVF
jgi:hypothetical protein